MVRSHSSMKVFSGRHRKRRQPRLAAGKVSPTLFRVVSCRISCAPSIRTARVPFHRLILSLEQSLYHSDNIYLRVCHSFLEIGSACRLLQSLSALQTPSRIDEAPPSSTGKRTEPPAMPGLRTGSGTQIKNTLKNPPSPAKNRTFECNTNIFMMAGIIRSLSWPDFWLVFVASGDFSGSNSGCLLAGRFESFSSELQKKSLSHF